MNFIGIFFVLLSLTSCSSPPKPLVSPDKYLKLNSLHAPKHKACILHRDHVLLKPVTELAQAARDDENYLFIRKEKTALKYLKHFDISKFTQKENLLEHEAIILGCVTKTAPTYRNCETLLPGYKFFRALIYGMSQYQWSRNTLIQARSKTLEYLKYVGESKNSLMDILLASDLLRRLSERHFVHPDIAPETFKIRARGEEIYQNLRAEIEKLGKKELTCHDASDFYKKERMKVDELSASFLKLLAKVHR